MQPILKRSLFALMVLLALVMTGAAVRSQAQTCTPRTDWTPYTVARGDTLWAIARRFGTTTADLMRGNCLTTTRIQTGQTLRVPVSGQGGVPQGGLSVRGAYQRFERGVMLWRSDTGHIWVLLDGGAVRNYPLAAYGSLPENLATGAPPPGLFRPILGFGKVWGFYSDVKNALGWATGSEQGCIMIIQQPSSGANAPNTYVSLPTGDVVQINTGGTWMYASSPPPQDQPFTVPAAFQQYERGFMVWMLHNGVMVFMNDRQTYTYGETEIQALFPNPVVETPPSGMLNPINAFGRVWGNLSNIRSGLGWATASEQAYTATKTNLLLGASSGYSITLPDGRTVISSYVTWSFAG